jgi:hypothetical protein
VNRIEEILKSFFYVLRHDDLDPTRLIDLSGTHRNLRPHPSLLPTLLTAEPGAHRKHSIVLSRRKPPQQDPLCREPIPRDTDGLNK